MTINELGTDIKNCFIEWGGHLFEANYYRHDGLLSWRDFSSEKLFAPILSPAIFLELREARQFSFSTEDGGFFQIYYEFGADDQCPIKARLAFYQLYSQQTMTAFEKDEMFYEEGSLESDQFVGVEEQEEYVRWLRIDFDPGAANGLLHFSCHAELSGFKGARIVIDSIPWPSQFVETVFHIFYPDKFQNMRQNPHSVPLQERLLKFKPAPDTENLRELIGRITFGRRPLL